MNRLSTRTARWSNRNPSDTQIYYNLQFPLRDKIEVLYPLFGSFYPYKEFLNLIHTTKHTFCAYDMRSRRCIGCALLNNAGSKGGLYIMLFGVRQTNQGRGTGTQLLETIIRWARQAGFTFIYLHVHTENFKAIGLYEKVGFVKHAYLPNYYSSLPKDPPDAIRMILLLR